LNSETGGSARATYIIYQETWRALIQSEGLFRTWWG